MKWNHYEPPPIGAGVLKTLVAVTDKHHKHYCRVGQGKLLILLKRFHGIDICRSTLCESMRFLRDNHYIKSYQGTHRNKYGKVVFGPNCYYLLPRALNWLKSLVGWGEKVLHLLRVRLSRHNVKTLSWNYTGFGDFLGVQSLKDEIKGVPLPIS